MDTMITDIEYTDLMLELTGKIFNKSYNGFSKIKEDMIQYSLLQLWKSKEKYDKTKGNIKSFMATIIYNSFNVFIRDNIYRGKDMFVSMDANRSDSEEENTTLADIIGKIDLKYKDIEYVEFLKEFDNIIAVRNKNKYNKINKDELHIIMELLVEGYCQKDISELLEVSRPVINRKIKVIKSIIEEIKNN